MNWKEFLKPNTQKIIIFAILLGIHYIIFSQILFRGPYFSTIYFISPVTSISNLFRFVMVLFIPEIGVPITSALIALLLEIVYLIVKILIFYSITLLISWPFSKKESSNVEGYEKLKQKYQWYKTIILTHIKILSHCSPDR